MSNNHLNSTVPPSFFDLSSLTYLYLSNNTLTGSIPSSFGDSKSLAAIWLDGNDLSGTVPAVPVPNGWPKMSKYFAPYVSIVCDRINTSRLTLFLYRGVTTRA